MGGDRAEEDAEASLGAGLGAERRSDEGVGLPDSVRRLAGCVSMEDVRDMARATLRPLGFTASAIGGFAPLVSGAKPFFYYQDWPAHWLALYARENFAASDFGVAEARRRNAPFTWLEAKAARKLSSDEKRVWRAVLDHGWRDGVNVPIHGPAGYFGLVAFAADHDGISPRMVSELAAFGIAAHRRCRELSGDQHATRPTARLSSRELEALRWVAAGLADAEIGGRMSISAHTAKGYVDSARVKLSARTRAQAVLMAYVDGLI